MGGTGVSGGGVAWRVRANARPAVAESRVTSSPNRRSPLSVGTAAPAPDVLTVQLLQRAAGNAAVTQLLAVQRDADAPPGQLNQAVEDLYGWLVANSAPTERVLHTILLQKDRRQELRQQYDAKFKRSLWDDLGVLGGDDVIRARRYLEFGTLRTADKIYIAIHGKLTDNPTVMRIVREIGGNRAASEADFTGTYGTEYHEDYTLPDGSASRIAGALMAEMLSATFADRFRVAAILAFGTTRAADDVKIATVQGFNDADLLFNALQREDPRKIAADFQASYQESLKDYLSRETSLHTKLRALMLIDDSIKPEDRLIETIRISTSGYTTADADFIFDAVMHATDAQVSAFKAAVAASDPRLKSMDDFFGGMSKEQRDRLNALVGIGDNSGILGDPVVRRLRGEGGNDADGIFDTLKNSTGAAYAAYKAAYDNDQSPLRQYVRQFANSAQKGWLLSYVFTDFRSRLNYVMANPGMDDYVVFLVSTFADAALRRSLAADPEFGGKLANLPTATQNRVLLAMEPSSMTPEERAVWLDAAVKRETASGVGSLTGAASALEDENRELQAAKERATAGGRQPTPEEQAEIDRMAQKTEDALTTFVKYRDELEAAVSTAVDMGVGLLVGIATGGVGSVEMALAAVARAAVANAMARVVSRKIVMGDRFDVIGADGAAAFVTGAVDGMLNVVAPVISRGVFTSAVEETAAEAATTTAPLTFKQFASTIGPKMAEGGAVGGMSGAVDSLTQDRTWSDGFDRGMRRVVENALKSAGAGAAASAVPPAVGALLAAAGSAEAFEAMIDALPDASYTLERVVLNPAVSTTASRLPDLVVQRADNWGKEFERYVDRKLWTDGLDGELPPMTFVMPGAYNGLDNGIDRIGVVIEGDTIHVYHFEMKWRNPAPPGQPAPQAQLESRSVGVQSGGAWTANAVEQLCTSDHATALAARDALRGMLARAQGKTLAAVTEQEVLQFLRANVTATRVVVVPVHVDVRRLWKQLGGIMRWGGKAKVVKVGMP